MSIGLLVAILLLVVLILLIVVVLMRGMMFPKMTEPVEAVEAPEVEKEVAAEHLSAAIRIATVSQTEGEVNRKALDELRREMEKMYPRVHSSLKREVINQYSLLYTWEGSNPDLPPVLLAAHMDVVPADPKTLDQWTYPPFAGQVADGYVWGRGALDLKGQLIAILEAVENLLKAGYQPVRRVYLAFGHDEEIGGFDGAQQISSYLEAQGEKLAVVLDEGGMITDGILPGIEVPVAMVGVAEKGYMTLKVTATGEMGHSSTPPRQTAIGVLAAAIARLENSPMTARTWMARRMFQSIGAAAPFLYQVGFANLWLLGGAIVNKMSKQGSTNATIRTTAAATMISGGIKDNVLPQEANAVINFRLMPGDTIAGVCEHVKKAFNDERVTFQPVEKGAWEPSMISSMDSTVYHSLEKIICQIYGYMPVAPYVTLGATDARYYSPICENVYRFSPQIFGAGDLPRIHGVDERISVEDLAQGVQFYMHLLKTWGEDTL
jgi:carboxypeptidase PM20D1